MLDAPTATHVRCTKCKLHQNAENPFVGPVWWDAAGDMQRGVPDMANDWLVVIGEPPSKAVDNTGDLKDWKSLERLKGLWVEMGILGRICYLPSLWCYPPHENGYPKVSHTQLGHCLHFNSQVITDLKPRAIFTVGPEAGRALVKRQDELNIAGRVYHWHAPDKASYTVIPLWGFAFINRDPERYSSAYKKQWRTAVSLVTNHSNLADIKADVEYDLALDRKAAERWFEEACSGSSPVVGFDVETVSLKNLGVWDGDFAVTLASFSSPDHPRSLIVPLNYPLISSVPGVDMGTRPAKLREVVDFLRVVLEDAKIQKIGHNIKFDALAMWRCFGIELRGVFQDTMLVNYTLHPDVKRLNKLDDLIRKYLPEKADYSYTLENYFAEHPEIAEEYSLLPHDVLFPYAALDTAVLFPLLDCLFRDVDKHEEQYPDPYFVRLEGRSSKHPTFSLGDYVTYGRRCHYLLTYELERNGISVDMEILEHVHNHYSRIVEDLGDSLSRNSDVVRFETEVLPGIVKPKNKRDPHTPQINWGSPKQVSAFLYDFLGNPVEHVTDTGAPSAAEAALVQLAAGGSEVSDILLRFRESTKFVDAFTSRLITDDPENSLLSKFDGRVHPSFNTDATGTGRLSCSKPNVQQIPSDGLIKRVYRSRYEHGWMIQRDYSGIEIRVLALFCRDESLLKALRNGEDIHLITQKYFFKEKADKHNKSQRTVCKKCLFGRIYGQGDKGLYDILRKERVMSPFTGLPITMEECKQFNELIDRAYPKTKDWIDVQRLNSVVDGNVSTAFGFVRPLPNLRSYASWVDLKSKYPDSGRAKRLGDEIQADLRKSQNSPIQGSAGDITIFAALECVKRLRKVNDRVKVCNLVHDSIWADVPDADSAYETVRVLCDVMDNVTDWLSDLLPGYDSSWIDIPIIGECEIGLNAKDTFVVAVEPSLITGETRMLLKVPKETARVAGVTGDEKGDVVLVDFLDNNVKLENYLLTKRRSF